MRRVGLGIVLACVLASTPLMAAGTVTLVGDANGADVGGGGVRRFTYDWIASSGGAVSGDTTTIAVKGGWLLKVLFLPNSGGTQPSNLYDAQLLDGHSIDLLGGMGANLSNSTGAIVAGPLVWVDNREALQLVIANAGTSTGGRLVIWVGPAQ